MKRNLFFCTLLLIGSGFLSPILGAETNPTSPTGDYNGTVTTAGSYDPFTGNAKREVTDLSVPGAVGAYPLKWTRILNTRNGIGGVLGAGGQWGHNYQWGLMLQRQEPPPHPPVDYEGPKGMIRYPDGRQVELDTLDYENFTVLAPYEGCDRIQAMGGGNYDLLLHDGGRVKFTEFGTLSSPDLRATEIVDRTSR